MNLRTRRDLREGVLEQWTRQYADWICSGHHPDKAAIRDRLAALDLEACSAADVNKAIGNESWTTLPACDECGTEDIEVVQLGQRTTTVARQTSVVRACAKP